MVKVLKIEDLDCAHCAAKIEEGIRALEGVHSATVSFLAQKITVDMEDEKSEELLKAIVSIAKKIEPDCTVLL